MFEFNLFKGLPYQMCGNALGLYIAPFLLEIAGVKLNFFKFSF